MVKAIGWAFCLLLGCVCANARADDTVRLPWEEYDKLIQSRQNVTALGPDLFGDKVDLSSGALSFSATDIAIPGNSALPVALARSMSVINRKGYKLSASGSQLGSIHDGAFADWDLDLPNLNGVFASYWRDTRCSTMARPPSVSFGPTHFTAEDYWKGYQADMPGGGMMMVANAGTAKPSSGGPYNWVTADLTYFSCLPTIKNGNGEGFLAITADGTRYWFDWMAQFYEPPLEGGTSGSSQISRRKNVLYATRVEDRFGNWVTYTYSNAYNAPGRLSGIASSDGRQVTLGYNAQGHIASASNGSQTWTYQYSYPSAQTGTLTAVILPDNSRWAINFAALSDATFRYYTPPPSAEEVHRTCTNPGDIFDGTPVTGTITHPSGAVGEFTVQPWRFGRSNVPELCANYTSIGNDPNDDMAIYAIAWDSFALISKRVSGPGLPTATWEYGYSSDISTFLHPSGGGKPVCQASGGCEAPSCVSDSCAGTTVALVNAPGGKWTQYTFGNSYRYNEGKLLTVEEGDNTSTLRTTTTSYELATSGQPFPTPLGDSLQRRGDGFTSEYLRPVRRSVVTQDGATFNRQVNGFDAFARPTGVTRWSSLGFSRTENVTYFDQTSAWVLGQTRYVVNADNNEVMAETEFDPATALPIKQYRFGKLLQTLGYRADGTIETVKDGNNNTTTVSNWKRGIPQTIAYADGTGESAVVNDLGWVMSTSDENGFTSSYGYDVMGRISSVTYPVNDTVNWNGKSSVFEPVGSSEFGLPAGHWRHVATQGNYRKTTYFDGLWRPVAEHEEDLANPSGTARWVARRYDDVGRVVFESYARNPYTDGWVNFDAAVNGTRTFYDALDRVKRVEQDSELGVLATITEYLPGFVRKTTNPRLKVTTETFQAYDQPTTDSPVWIELPEGVVNGIVRDPYMKPLDLIRFGPNG